MAVQVKRWKFYQPSTGLRWTVPINPNEMSTPHPAQSTTAYPGSHINGKIRTFRRRRSPFEWSFSGVGIGYEHYRQLATWGDMEDRVHITDHFDRTWEVYMVQFDPTDRKPTPKEEWRFTYTMKTLMLGPVPD